MALGAIGARQAVVNGPCILMAPVAQDAPLVAVACGDTVHAAAVHIGPDGEGVFRSMGFMAVGAGHYV